MHDIPLLDHHCHGVVTGELTRAKLEALMSESYLPPAPGTSQFQKPLGLAIRRHCAPLLDLEPLATAEEYCARRESLGNAEVNRRLLSASTVSEHLIDTGHRAVEISTPAEFARICGHRVREVVRIEAVAEELAASGCSADTYAQRLTEVLRARAAQAVQCGAAGVAVISAITAAAEPEAAMATLRQSISAAASRPRWTAPALARPTLAP